MKLEIEDVEVIELLVGLKDKIKDLEKKLDEKREPIVVKEYVPVPYPVTPLPRPWPYVEPWCQPSYPYPQGTWICTSGSTENAVGAALARLDCVTCSNVSGLQWGDIANVV